MSNDFGEALRRLRHSRGLRQVDLEAAGGWHPKFIGTLEVGRRRPTPSALLKLAELLAVDIEWLSGLEQAKPGEPVHPPKVLAVRGGRRGDWKPDEVEQLRRLSAEGLPTREIAGAIGRTAESVRVKARKAGFPLDRHRRPS